MKPVSIHWATEQKQNKKILANIQVFNNAIKNFRMPTGCVCIPWQYRVKALISSEAQSTRSLQQGPMLLDRPCSWLLSLIFACHFYFVQVCHWIPFVLTSNLALVQSILVSSENRSPWDCASTKDPESSQPGLCVVLNMTLEIKLTGPETC